MSAEYILCKNYFEKYKPVGGFFLVQLGRISCQPCHIIGRHTHLDWFELTVVTEGEGIIETNGESLEVSKGDIYLSFPCEVHSIKTSEKKPLKYDFLSFVPSGEKYKTAFEKLVKSYPGAKERVVASHAILSIIDGCINVMLEAHEDKYTYVQLSLELVALEIIRFFAKQRNNALPQPETNESVICNSVKSYIDTHIFSIKSLSELSEVTSYNYSYLSNVFKTVTGQTISDYYKKLRFEKAKVLLSEGGRRITDISNLLGYSSVYAFSKAFKDETGVSPKAYLGRIKKNPIIKLED